MVENSTVQNLASHDFLEMHAAVERAYFPHQLHKLSRPTGSGIVRTLQLGPVTLGRIRWGADVALDCEYAEDAYEINIVLEGKMSWERDGRSWEAGCGEAAVFLPGKRSTITHWGSDTSVLGVKISRGTLHNHLPADATATAPLEEITPAALDLRSSEGRSWITFLQSSAEQIISDPAVVSMPAFRDSLVMSVAAPMAAFLAPTQESSPPGPYMIRRVRAAVEHNPGRRWTLDDMAAVSGVGRRRLQQAFRDYVGETPTRWLLRVRLDQAYRLLVSETETITVHEVAYACGFNHLGRFAQEFRARFGCLPSEIRHHA